MDVVFLNLYNMCIDLEWSSGAINCETNIFDDSLYVIYLLILFFCLSSSFGEKK